MTDEQRQFAEENHGLIYKFLSTYHYSLNAVEDYYGLAAIGYCKAVITYDKERDVAFSTYAYACMLTEIRHDKQLVRNKLQLTLYDNIQDADKWLIQDFRNMIKEKEFNISVQQYLSAFDERTQLIVRHWLYGRKTFKEISEMIGLSKQRTHVLLHNFLKKARKDHVIF